MHWVTEVIVTCVRLQARSKKFSETKIRNKNQNFWFMEKHLSYNIHIWKNVYHRDFIQCSVRMALYGIVWQEVSHIWKLYDKKFWSTRVYHPSLYLCFNPNKLTFAVQVQYASIYCAVSLLVEVISAFGHMCGAHLTASLFITPTYTQGSASISSIIRTPGPQISSSQV